MRRAMVVASLSVAGVGSAAEAIAYATVPDGNHTVHGCYSSATGMLRIVDSSSTSPLLRGCLSSELPIMWNQTGPTGPAGPQGVSGSPGPFNDDTDRQTANCGLSTGEATSVRVDAHGDGDEASLADQDLLSLDQPGAVSLWCATYNGVGVAAKVTAIRVDQLHG